jgi:hypothetical protein
MSRRLFSILGLMLVISENQGRPGHALRPRLERRRDARREQLKQALHTGGQAGT